eukprot:PhM_4_TR18614/c3_g4_i2/m.83702
MDSIQRTTTTTTGANAERYLPHVPTLLVDTCHYLRKTCGRPNGCTGLFTKKPNSHLVHALELKLDALNTEIVRDTRPWVSHLETNSVAPNVACALLLRFLERLPQPIFPSYLVGRVDEAGRAPTARRRAEIVKHIFSDLPSTYVSNYDTLLYLFNFLHESTAWDSQGDVHEVALEFVPVVFGHADVNAPPPRDAREDVPGRGTDSLGNVCLDEAVHSRSRADRTLRAKVLELCIRYPHVVDYRCSLAKVCTQCHERHFARSAVTTCPGCGAENVLQPYLYNAVGRSAVPEAAAAEVSSAVPAATVETEPAPVIRVEGEVDAAQPPTTAMAPVGDVKDGEDSEQQQSDVQAVNLDAAGPLHMRQETALPMDPLSSSSSSSSSSSGSSGPASAQQEKSAFSNEREERDESQDGHRVVAADDSDQKSVADGRSASVHDLVLPPGDEFMEVASNSVASANAAAAEKGHRSACEDDARSRASSNSAAAVYPTPAAHPNVTINASGISHQNRSVHSRASTSSPFDSAEATPTTAVLPHPVPQEDQGQDKQIHTTEQRQQQQQNPSQPPPPTTTVQYVTAVSDDRIFALEKRLEHLANENAYLKVEVTELKSQMSSSRADRMLKTMTGVVDVSDLQAEVKLLREENAGLREELSHVGNQTVQHLRDLAVRTNRVEMKVLAQQAQTSQHEHQQSSQRSEALHVTSELAKLKEWVSRVQVDLQRHSGLHNESLTGLRALQSEIDAARKEIAALRAHFDVVLDNHADALQIETHLESMQMSLSDASRRERSLASRVNALDQVNSATSEKLKCLDAAMAAASSNRAFNTGFSRNAPLFSTTSSGYSFSRPTTNTNGGAEYAGSTGVPMAEVTRRELMRLYSS